MPERRKRESSDDTSTASEIAQLCDTPDSDRKRDELNRMARTQFGITFAERIDTRTMCQTLMSLFESEKRAREGPAPCVSSSFPADQVSACADAVVRADPNRYGWLKNVSSEKQGPALCFIGVREFGYPDEEIRNIPLFCKNMRRDIQQATTLSEDITTDECPICMDAMTILDAAITECGHTGHKDCMRDAIAVTEQRCPICKQENVHMVPLTALGRAERARKERGPGTARILRPAEAAEAERRRREATRRTQFSKNVRDVLERRRQRAQKELREAVLSNDEDRIAQVAQRHPTMNPNFRNKWGETVLMIAAEHFKDKSIRALKRAFPQIDPNIQTKEGYTALITAAQRAWLQSFGEVDATLRALKESFPGIDANMRDKRNHNALMNVVWGADTRSAVETVRLLGKYFPDIDPNVKDWNQGNTALMRVALLGIPGLARALKESFPSIDPNVQNKWGDTALILTQCSTDYSFIEKNDITDELVEVFPEINFTIRNHEGQTAEIAAEQGCPDRNETECNVCGEWRLDEDLVWCDECNETLLCKEGDIDCGWTMPDGRRLCPPCAEDEVE